MTKKQKKMGTTFILIVTAFFIMCPIISYASGQGVMHLQNKAIGTYQERNSVPIASEDVKENILVSERKPCGTDVDFLKYATPKGSNDIDYILAATGEAHFSALNLQAGASIRIVLISDNDSDQYRAGIINESGIRYYVVSKNGVIGQTFNIDSDGEYIVFFEGRNTNGKVTAS